MIKPEISVIVPTIRSNNLERFYNSILTTTKRSFELILVGPYALPKELEQYKNIKYVRDFGSPVRCSNIGFQLTEGNIITDCTDDAVYYPEALDRSINLLYDMGSGYKNVVLHQYLEGKDGTNKIQQSEDYYKINNAQCTKSSFISDDWYVFNSFVMYKEFAKELEFLDCSFQGTAMAHISYGIEAYRKGANVQLYHGLITDCDHDQNDHNFIERAQIDQDEPLFQSIYRNPGWIMRDNSNKKDWKDVESVWTRFK